MSAACVVSVLMSIGSCSRGDESPPPPSPASSSPPDPKLYEALEGLPTLRVGDSTKRGQIVPNARFTIRDITYLAKIRINDEESVKPDRGFFVRIDISLEVHGGLDLRSIAYDWTSPQGDELEQVNPEAAIAWEYNPLGRRYVGSGWAEGTLLMDVPKKGGKVTVHLASKFVIQLPSK